MNFALDDDQLLLRDTTRKYLEATDSLGRLRQRLDADETVDRDEWRSGAELGWASMLIPEHLGGGSVTSQPLVDLAVLCEELGSTLHPAPYIPTAVVADALVRAAQDPHADLLGRIAAGEVVAAWCATADGSASADSTGVTASAGEDGSVRLDGLAGFVHGAAAADVLLVGARGEGGLAHYVVPRNAPGVTLRPLQGLDVTRRFSEVSFDGVTAAGPSVGGEEVLDRGISLATVLQAASAAGAADRIVSATVHYARDRIQFGRPIGSFQAIKHRLADLHVQVEAVRSAAYYSALALGDGLPDAAEAVAVAGSYVKDAFAWICGEAIQLHGGIGFTWEHDAHLYLRRAKTDQVLYGEPYWHRERLVQRLEAKGA